MAEIIRIERKINSKELRQGHREDEKRQKRKESEEKSRSRKQTAFTTKVLCWTRSFATCSLVTQDNPIPTASSSVQGDQGRPASQL